MFDLQQIAGGAWIDGDGHAQDVPVFFEQREAGAVTRQGLGDGVQDRL